MGIYNPQPPLKHTESSASEPNSLSFISIENITLPVSIFPSHFPYKEAVCPLCVLTVSTVGRGKDKTWKGVFYNYCPKGFACVLLLCGLCVLLKESDSTSD